MGLLFCDLEKNAPIAFWEVVQDATALFGIA
jgi:hypothetical protein